jgi:TonB-dependent starch-binding outer membrane protein SusC
MIEKLKEPVAPTAILMFLFLANSFAQQRPITGNVKNLNDEGLSGVTITVAGTQTNAITDRDGMFSILANEGILVFSLQGYVTKEVEIGNQTTISLVLIKAGELMVLNAIQGQYPMPSVN